MKTTKTNGWTVRVINPKGRVELEHRGLTEKTARRYGKLLEGQHEGWKVEVAPL